MLEKFSAHSENQEMQKAAQLLLTDAQFKKRVENAQGGGGAKAPCSSTLQTPIPSPLPAPIAIATRTDANSGLTPAGQGPVDTVSELRSDLTPAAQGAADTVPELRSGLPPAAQGAADTVSELRSEGGIPKALKASVDELNGARVKVEEEKEKEKEKKKKGQVSTPYFKSTITSTNARYATRTVNPTKFSLPNGSPLQQDGDTRPILQTIPKTLSKKNPPPIVPQASLDYEQRVASQCKHCLKKFSRVSFYQKHVNSSSCFLSRQNKGFWCSFCARFFASEHDKKVHERVVHLRGEQVGGGEEGEGNFPMLRIQDRHGCKVYRKQFEEGEVQTIEASFLRLRKEMIAKVSTDLKMHKIIKFGVITVGSFAKLDEDGNESEKAEIPMRSRHFKLFLSDERRVRVLYGKCQKQTLERLEEIEQTGSGWTLVGIAKVLLEVGKCNLIGGSNPRKRRREEVEGGEGEDENSVVVPHGRQFLIDVDGKDQRCFANSFAQHFIREHTLPATRDWVSKNLRLDGIKFPMNLKKVSTFERKNKHLGIGINVFLLEGKQCYPVHKSVRKVVENCANLLLVPYVCKKQKRYHYMYISDLDSFLGSYETQLGTKRQRLNKHCINCLSGFSTEETLKEHQLICLKNEVQKISLPAAGKKLKFDKHLNSFGHEFIGFADFETYLAPFERTSHKKCKNCQEMGDISLCKHATSVLNNQEPVCYSLVFVDREKNIVFQRSECSDDIMPLFFKALEDAQELLLPQLQAAKKQMVWLDSDQETYKNAKSCHICKEPFESEKDKVRDHCHRSGRWVGAAHAKCNVDRRVKNTLLCYMHNFSGFDSHFVIRYYRQLQGREKRVRGLAYNSEKFRTVDVGKMQFVDSLSLLDAGLGELVNDLVKEKHSFPILEASGIYDTEEQRELLVKSKGIYPYEYITSYETLLETELPPIEKFYSTLKDERVSEADYEQAQATFRAFKCRDLRDYTRLYCHLDTLQLAEVMLEFMQEVEKDFDLCSTNYISLPQLSFDAMLKSTGVELDYIPDQEMTLLFENSIRGGVSYVNTRHVDVEKEGGIIEYYDANNLYGKAQMEFLPMGNYRWLSEEELKQFDDLEVLMKKPKDDPKGWALEVDLVYPEELRKSRMHQNMPLAPEHLQIFHCDLSEYSRECLNVTTGKKSNERYHSSKLCGTFNDKNRYLVHYRNLQFYLRHGLKLTKIHRVIEFDQGDFSKQYIEFTAKKRATSTSDFKKRMAKLLANANFGKWLQNVRKYIEVKIVTKESAAAKYINSPRYISSRQLSPDLIGIFMKKKKVVLDRKYSIGFSILEISKLIMYEYFYETIVPRFGEENVDILLSDTDSFVLHIRNHTRERAREMMADVMDYSNLAKTDSFYDSSRAKVPGYLKSETPTSEILECVAPKSKCYALRSVPVGSSSSEGEEEKKESVEKKCKGITKSRIKKMKIDSYRECIQKMSVIRTQVARLQSRDHNVQTILQNKISLSSFCDKRFLLHCGKHSLPYQKGGWPNTCQICST